MHNGFIQEAVTFEYGNNFIPINNRFRNPVAKKDVSIFLLSDSFENDIGMIHDKPAVQMEYNHIIIPYRIIDKIGIRPFRFIMTQNEYNNKLVYINNMKLQPKLIPIKYPYPKTIEDNLYIPMSEIVKHVTPIIRRLGVKYIRDNIFDIFNKLFGMFTFSSRKILIIDTKNFKIYQHPSTEIYMSDLINALFTALLFNPQNKIKKIDFTIIFRTEKTDVRFELDKYNIKTDSIRLRRLLDKIGSPIDIDESDIEESLDDIDEDSEESVDDEIDSDSDNNDDVERIGMDVDEEDDVDIKQIQNTNTSVTKSINTTIESLKAKFASKVSSGEENNNIDKTYNAKTLSVNASLLKRINPKISDINNNVNSYNKIATDLTTSATSSNAEEVKIVDDTAKTLSTITKPVNEKDVDTTITSARELQLRNNLGQIKLNGLNIDAVSSVTDMPLPEPTKPVNTTTTNVGSAKGTSFPNFAKAYEDNLLDKDIVATFMNLSNLPNGLVVKNIEVTDISTITTMMNNWHVTLQSNTSTKPMSLNVRVPHVINGRFLYNGKWYNIGKQDFPIPILKINKKKVMLTSNYNKISVERYDTRSLVDISMLIKVLNKATNIDGSNQFIRQGSSVNTNSRFISTIEFDEYAKQWHSFINKEAKCEVYFNRAECAQKYSFVTVQPNEFCCGMINKVPIVINTETSLTRQGSTLTDLMLSTLSEDLRNSYKSLKPGKVSMYAEITISIKIPLGVACCAWEGLSTVLKKSGCKFQYVDKNFYDTKYMIIPFKDKYLAIENTVTNQLIFNGFNRINTKAYNISDFENTIMSSNSIYVDIFNQLFFKQYSQLTTFITYYNFFVDTITKEVCLHYNIPTDIVGMLLYSAKLLSDNNFTSENNSALYRIRSSEIIPAIIHYRLAYAISKYNNAVGSKNRENKIPFNPNDVINELITVKTVNPISALNPVVELNSREIVSKIGFRGVNNNRTFTQEKRSYDESYIGKMALSSPNNANVGINRQLVADPKIDSLRGYTSTTVNDNYNDLQLSSFSELLTPGTVTRDDAIRTAIATSQSSHIVATEAAQPVIVSNGVDEIVPSYLSDEFTVVAEDDGIVIDDKDDYMIIEYKSKKKKAINIGNRYSFNTGSGFYVDNKLKSNFEMGDTFVKGDILAYHEKFFTKDSSGVVRMNIGPLAKVAFAGLYSTYEDAGLVTHKMSKKLSTTLSMMQQVKLNASDDIESVVKVGDTIEVGDPLVVFGLGGSGDKAVDNFLRAFQSSSDDKSIEDASKRKIRAKHAGKIVDVRMYTIKSMDKLSPSLFEILDKHFKENRKRRKILDKYDKSNNVYKLETLYDLPTEPLKGATIKGIHSDVVIEIKIEHSDDASVGDKLVAYGAAKQIISEVVPEGMEPYTENRPSEEVSMFVSPSSILKRMIPSLMITSATNKVMIVLKEKITNIWNDKE